MHKRSALLVLAHSLNNWPHCKGFKPQEKDNRSKGFRPDAINNIFENHIFLLRLTYFRCLLLTVFHFNLFKYLFIKNDFHLRRNAIGFF
jgi:hypothetical protein